MFTEAAPGEAGRMSAQLSVTGYCGLRGAVPPWRIAAIGTDPAPHFGAGSFERHDLIGDRLVWIGHLLLRSPVTGYPWPPHSPDIAHAFSPEPVAPGCDHRQLAHRRTFEGKCLPARFAQPKAFAPYRAMEFGIDALSQFEDTAIPAARGPLS